MNSRHCTSWSEIPEAAASSGVAKRALEGAAASLAMVRIPAGTTSDRHSHAHEQFVQVVSGSGWLETEQGERAFGAGSLFHFPANAWHKATFDTETVLIETNLHAAPR